MNVSKHAPHFFRLSPHMIYLCHSLYPFLFSEQLLTFCMTLYDVLASFFLGANDNKSASVSLQFAYSLVCQTDEREFQTRKNRADLPSLVCSFFSYFACCMILCSDDLCSACDRVDFNDQMEIDHSNSYDDSLDDWGNGDDLSDDNWDA